MKKINRRKFIEQASCAALGTTTFFNTIMNLSLTNAIAAERFAFSNDYKALVCILLAGGNDSFNMVLPRGNTEYDEYAATRTNLSIQQGDILPIYPNTNDGKDYGLHPSFPDVQTLFNNGDLSFIANVGTLIEPVQNASEYYSGTKQLPLGLYSHSDQVKQWQTSVPQSRDAVGWGGRLADIIQSMNSFQGISMNISLSGRNVFQAGNSVLEYSISNDGNGAEGIDGYRWESNAGFLNYIRALSIDNMVSDTYSNIFQQAISEQTHNAIENQEVFANAVAKVPPFQTQFTNHYLSENLEMTAKVIAARQDLGMSRQIFFMSVGGYDNHGELLSNQATNLSYVNDALKSFNDVMAEIGMSDKVTTFTISDFARTLTTNGNGSDHAWGGQQLVMGGAVNGKDIYGTYPELALSSPLNISSRGVLIPTTSADEVFAELALWFGLDPGDLPTVLPNIGNFYAGGPDWPIGFLQSS